MGIDVRDPDQMVGTLSGGERQAVAIARAVYFGAKMLILDEPTSALGVKQSGVVLRYIVQARDARPRRHLHHPQPASRLPGRRPLRGPQPRQDARGLGQGRHRPRRAGEDDGRRCRARAAHARAGAGDQMTQAQPAAEVLGGGQRTRIGVGLIGFGWLGQAHTRSLLRIPTLFGDRPFETELMVCADNVPARLDEAVGSFGYAAGTADWRAVVEHPDVDVVYITAPNMLHLELIEAAAAAGKDIFCEKPVGGTPEQTERAAARGPRRHHGGGLQLPLGAARAVREAADRRRPAGRDHQLPRPLLLDVRQRSAQPAVVALPRRGGRPRRLDRPAQPFRGPRAHAARPDRARGRDDRDVHPRAAGVHVGHALRARQRRGPARPGDQRGLRRDAVRVRLRRARHVRGQPHDRRPREPDGVRGLRHARAR